MELCKIHMNNVEHIRELSSMQTQAHRQLQNIVTMTASIVDNLGDVGDNHPSNKAPSSAPSSPPDGLGAGLDAGLGAGRDDLGDLLILSDALRHRLSSGIASASPAREALALATRRWIQAAVDALR